MFLPGGEGRQQGFLHSCFQKAFHGFLFVNDLDILLAICVKLDVQV